MLGFEYTRDHVARTISMAQSAYIDTMLDRFRMTNANPLSLPLNPNDNIFVSPLDTEERVLMQRKPYAKLIGSLLYAAIGTRPDIAYSVSLLARFMHDPAIIHFEAAKRVLRYLKGTRDSVLTFGSNSKGLMVYSDSDWASHPDRHSVEGVVVMYNGGAIYWRSSKQKLVSLSSTESEYIAASNASRELVSARQVYSELMGTLSSRTPLFIDNKSTIKNILSNLINPRTKHIDICFHHIRETANLFALILHCPTEDMAANILTKALSARVVKYLSSLLGLHSA